MKYKYKQYLLYVCMYDGLARVWINRVRLPINPARGQLNTGKINVFLSAFAPENLVSRDGFGGPASVSGTGTY